VPKAFLVAKADADPAAVANEVLSYVPSAWRPTSARRYEFVESIPRTPSGKIVRRTLTERERRVAGVAMA
jgi:acyl-coenzyme A synthetase/AMP-(fatty) acid ligase